MAPDVCGGLRNSPSSAKSRHVLKKGPWTTAEDMLLLEYVKKHGEGNWNAVQRNSGLMRCGKSCRLRWANHLRPNLKKGAFTPDEEKLIVELHAKIGNKWARMAAQLPGRTDNEIKNYWNTRLKRRQRAGLPVYPHELAHQEQQQQQFLNSSSQTPSLSSLLASTHPQNPNPFTFSPSIISPQDNSPYLNHQFNLYRDNNGSLSLSLDASNSLFSSCTSPAPTFFNQEMENQLPMTSLLQYNSLNYGINTSPEMGILGLPSIQSPAQVAVTPAASSNEFLVATTSSDGDDYEVERGFERTNTSGLLEDLFGESRALAYPGKPEEPFIAAAENVHEEAAAFSYDHGITNSDDNYQGSEAKASGENVVAMDEDLMNLGAGPEANTSGESIVAMDDDLMNLLDNFPLSVPIPDWNGGDGSESPILNNGTTNEAIESQPNASEYNPVASPNQDRNFGSNWLWNNMPSIY